MRLEAFCAQWEEYWRTTVDVSEVERQLRKLRMLEDFAFHCGTAIAFEQYRAVQIQVEAGEKKLAELRGDFFVIPNAPQPVSFQAASLIRSF